MARVLIREADAQAVREWRDDWTGGVIVIEEIGGPYLAVDCGSDDAAAVYLKFAYNTEDERDARGWAAALDAR